MNILSLQIFANPQTFLGTNSSSFSIASCLKTKYKKMPRKTWSTQVETARKTMMIKLRLSKHIFF